MFGLINPRLLDSRRQMDTNKNNKKNKHFFGGLFGIE